MLLPGCSAGSAISPETRQRAAVHPAQVIRYFHQTHAKDLELARQFHRRVLARQGLEIVVAGAEFEPGDRRETARKRGAELRAGVDAGADRGAALRQPVQAGRDRRQARGGRVDLRLPRAQFLRQRDRHRIHQMRAAGLDRVAEFGGSSAQDRAQVFERRQQTLVQQQRGGDMDRGRHHVVAALTHVHLIVRVHGSRQRPRRQGCDHLIGVHVAAGAGSGLKHVDGEMLVVSARGHLERRRLDRRRQVQGKIAELGVGGGGGMLDETEGANEATRHAQSRGGKILQGALGLGAPQSARRHIKRAHAVALDAGGCCHRALLRVRLR